jgi:LPXTG-motif cell wall-anchored protein
LPYTGSNITDPLLIGLLALGVGATLLIFTRRREVE